MAPPPLLLGVMDGLWALLCGERSRPVSPAMAGSARFLLGTARHRSTGGMDRVTPAARYNSIPLRHQPRRSPIRPPFVPQLWGFCWARPAALSTWPAWPACLLACLFPPQCPHPIDPEWTGSFRSNTQIEKDANPCAVVPLACAARMGRRCR